MNKYRIGFDFDNVILDIKSDYDLEDISSVASVSDGVIDLLQSNKVVLICTARRNLVDVLLWIEKWCSLYKGEIQSVATWGGSKGMYCAYKGIDVFVDDQEYWKDEIEEWGVKCLHFVKDRDKCPKLLLENEGWL